MISPFAISTVKQIGPQGIVYQAWDLLSTGYTNPHQLLHLNAGSHVEAEPSNCRISLHVEAPNMCNEMFAPRVFHA